MSKKLRFVYLTVQLFRQSRSQVQLGNEKIRRSRAIAASELRVPVTSVVEWVPLRPTHPTTASR